MKLKQIEVKLLFKKLLYQQSDPLAPFEFAEPVLPLSILGHLYRRQELTKVDGQTIVINLKPNICIRSNS